jgi:hypothetical protein
MDNEKPEGPGGTKKVAGHHLAVGQAVARPSLGVVKRMRSMSQALSHVGQRPSTHVMEKCAFGDAHEAPSSEAARQTQRRNWRIRISM